MKILIEVPTWLGDCVMATPAIENIIQIYPDCKITIFGSKASSSIFNQHLSVEHIIIDESRSAKNRYVWLYKMAKNLKFDTIFSFRRQFSAKFFAFFINSKHRYHYQRYDHKSKHQVLRYNEFVNQVLQSNKTPGRLFIALNQTKTHHTKPLLGINPGASYGSAKRWYPAEFAKVAIGLAQTYDIVIFGGMPEVDIAGDIEAVLIKNHIKNYQNLAGKTTMHGLLNKIANLDLFITGDSGPMHIAAAFGVPTVAIFGPTTDTETSQWDNHKSVIVKKSFSCQPCMKRICPIKEVKNHHQCMKDIDAQEVLAAVKTLKTL